MALLIFRFKGITLHMGAKYTGPYTLRDGNERPMKYPLRPREPPEHAPSPSPRRRSERGGQNVQNHAQCQLVPTKAETKPTPLVSRMTQINKIKRFIRLGALK